MPFNVEFSEVGWALACNGPFFRYIQYRTAHLTSEEEKRGYIKIPVKGITLVLIVGPDNRSQEEKLQDNDQFTEPPSAPAMKRFLTWIVEGVLEYLP